MTSAFRRRTAIAVFFLVLALLAFSASLRADEPENKNWSLEAELRGGYVYEFTGLAQNYRGFEVAVRYAPAPWTLLARIRSDSYVMPYFGMTWDTFHQIMTPGGSVSSALTQYNADERRNDLEIAAGYAVSGNIVVFGGGRYLDLNNDFSRMKQIGPSVRLEVDFATGRGKVQAGLDGAWFMHTVIDNKRGYPDFIVPDGERTLSFYGEPRYTVGWRAAIFPLSGDWSRLSFGYDGSILGLKYGYRYYHGISIGARF